MMKKRSFRLPWEMLPVIFTLAWPTMLEQFMQTAVQYIDTAMVGSLGTQATAAVGATTTVGWLVGSSISALGVGFLSFIARAYGANDKERAARVASQAVLAVLFSGIVLFNLITLPVEVDASRRALAEVERMNLLTDEELAGGKKVLFAAGMTYFISLMASVVQLLRLLSLANRRR